jgi:hypothetical protein
MRKVKRTTRHTVGFKRLLSFADGTEIYWKVAPEKNRLEYLTFYGRAMNARDHFYIQRASFAATLNAFAAVLVRIADGVDAHSAHKALQKAARRLGAVRLEVGSILCGSWGYDQTNVEFFEVMSLSATRKTCAIRELRHDERASVSSMSGKVFPLPGEYTGPLLERKLVQNDTVKLDVCTLSLWDGRELYASHYA